MKARRWLTPAEKAETLRAWETTKRESPVVDRGGAGYPDPTIVPWCDRINGLPGVCTLQSCAGHLKDGGILHSGHLWLKLSEQVSAEFRQAAFELAGSPGIERVEMIFQPSGEEVASVTFQGDEHDLLQSSMGTIMSFLEEVSRRAHGVRDGYFVQLPALSFPRHSLQSSPEVGLVARSS